MNASGTTKRFAPAIVAAGLPVFAASGTGHAPGLVPDPGGSAGATRYLREDATWFTPAGGGGGSPGGSTGQIQYNSAGSFAGASALALGASGEVIYGAIADPTLAAGASWQNSTLAVESGVSVGMAFRKGGTIWTGKTGTAVASTSALTSIFTGATTIDGSLIIPANKAIVGKTFRLCLFGSMKATGTPTITIQVLLGGVTICSGTSTALAAGGPNLWSINSSEFQIQAIGASGKIIGHAIVVGAGLGTWPLGSAGLNTLPAQATVDFTAGAAWDFKVQWSVADVNNSFQLLYGHIEILN
jgi:hypothetical protein